MHDGDPHLRNPMYKQIYVMEASCPHLGADMSHAEIEECETGTVAVCPWHRCVSISFKSPRLISNVALVAVRYLC